MADVPFLRPRSFQFRGPKDSSDYNARLEEMYRDMVALYNRARLAELNQSELYRCAYKEIVSLSATVNELAERIQALEDDLNIITFSSVNQVSIDRFVGTGFEVPSNSVCSIDSIHGIVTLPKVETSSLSKLFFTNTIDIDVLPSTLETRVVPNQSTADSSAASIDTSDPELAIIRRSGRIWERNVITASPDSVNGAQMTLYVKIPTDLFTTEKSNCLVVHPFPVYSTDILEIAYSNSPVIIMDDSDNYIALNSDEIYSGDTDAIGWVPPGGWSGDEYIDAGLRAYYFNPALVTGIRIKFRQRNYYRENSRYIYSYGLSKLDLRYDKFLSTGKTIIQFDAPEGQTISSIDDIQPQIWNVPEAALADVFSYRVIWETAPDSEVYTLTPVSLSEKVWIEVTLTETSGHGSPAMSDLVVSYS